MPVIDFTSAAMLIAKSCDDRGARQLVAGTRG
jgi:hypothetical protein